KYLIMKKSYLLYFFFILLPFYSCSQQNTAKDAEHVATDIDSTASKHKLANELNFTQEGKNNLEIKSVLMKRTACFGTCPVYKVKFKLDGTAIYNGIRYVDKKGKYKGKFGSYNYGKLISFINKIEFEDFN